MFSDTGNWDVMDDHSSSPAPDKQTALIEDPATNLWPQIAREYYGFRRRSLNPFGIPLRQKLFFCNGH